MPVGMKLLHAAPTRWRLPGAQLPQVTPGAVGQPRDGLGEVFAGRPRPVEGNTAAMPRLNSTGSARAVPLPQFQGLFAPGRGARPAPPPRWRAPPAQAEEGGVERNSSSARSK